MTQNSTQIGKNQRPLTDCTILGTQEISPLQGISAGGYTALSTRSTTDHLSLHLEAIGAPITANSCVAHQLKSKGKKHRYNKDYKKTEYAKTCRSTLRINKYRLYDSHTTNKDTVHYKKKLQNSPSKMQTVTTRCHQLSDHSYCK